MRVPPIWPTSVHGQDERNDSLIAVRHLCIASSMNLSNYLAS